MTDTNAAPQGQQDAGAGQQTQGAGAATGAPNAAAGAPQQTQPQQTQQTPAGQDQGQQQTSTPGSAVPDKYELKLGDGALLKPDAIERTAAIARELGLSQEGAQKALDYAAAEVKAYHEALIAEHRRMGEEWKQQIATDPEIAGEKGDQLATNVELARRAARHWGGEELLKALDETGYGNHPLLVRMFMRIGKAMADDKLVTGNRGGTEPRDPAQVLYGGQTATK